MGTSIAPKLFNQPLAYGGSGSSNILQESQAAPQITVPDFIPLNPQQAQPAPAAQPQPMDDPQDDPMSAAMRYRSRSSPRLSYMNEY